MGSDELCMVLSVFFANVDFFSPRGFAVRFPVMESEKDDLGRVVDYYSDPHVHCHCRVPEVKW
jgi:hypothetical protein